MVDSVENDSTEEPAAPEKLVTQEEAVVPKESAGPEPPKESAMSEETAPGSSWRKFSMIFMSSPDNSNL